MVSIDTAVELSGLPGSHGRARRLHKKSTQRIWSLQLKLIWKHVVNWKSRRS